MTEPRKNSAGPIFQADKNWTFDRAWQEEEACGREGPDTPFFQWVALQEIDRLERDFGQGDHLALMRAVSVCALHGLVMPDWVAISFLRRYRRVTGAECGSWDDAFGRPYPKGTQLKSLRRDRKLKYSVYKSIRRRLDQSPQTAIDEGLFEYVGAEFGIGKTKCSELYAAAKRVLEGIPRKSKTSRHYTTG